MINTSTITASEARDDFYNIIKKASRGLRAFEVKLRGADPVLIISKNEIEEWLETLDVMTSPEEAEAIKEGKRERKRISHADLKKLLGI